MHAVERIVDTNDAKGTFHIVKEQDCTQILKTINELPEHLRYRQSTQHCRKLLYSLPNILAVNWAKEWGVQLYTREFFNEAHKRVMNDPNWSKLRIQY